MLLDLLNLTSVQVAREVVTPDGMGGSTTTTTLTTLTKAAIWQAGQGSSRYLSDRIYRASTHVLATVPSFYTWTQDDRFVVNGDAVYKVVGRPDDVVALGEMTVVGLEQLT